MLYPTRALYSSRSPWKPFKLHLTYFKVQNSWNELKMFVFHQGLRKLLQQSAQLPADEWVIIIFQSQCVHFSILHITQRVYLMQVNFNLACKDLWTHHVFTLTIQQVKYTAPLIPQTQIHTPVKPEQCTNPSPTVMTSSHNLFTDF